MRAAICLDYSRYFRGIFEILSNIAAGVNGATMYYSVRIERWNFHDISPFVLLES